MGACRARASSISHLLLLPSPSPPTAQSGNPNKLSVPKSSPVNRRLFLITLPVPALLLFTGSGDSTRTSTCLAAEGFDPVSSAERDASALISRRIGDAVGLLDKGRELQAQGDFGNALLYFSKVVENYKDFAFSEYARVGRALALYEVGDREEAIAEMEDVSISLKGYPEIHAALAAALYVDKHAPLLAENQFTIATLLDPHYTDISYVKDTKHWPPSLCDPTGIKRAFEHITAMKSVSFGSQTTS